MIRRVREGEVFPTGLGYQKSRAGLVAVFTLWGFRIYFRRRSDSRMGGWAKRYILEAMTKNRLWRLL